MKAALVARYAWASPCTLVGLLLVAPTFLFGARASVVDGVIEIANPLFEGPSDKKLWPFRAITFGHVVMKLWNRNGNEPPDPAQPATAPGYNP